MDDNQTKHWLDQLDATGPIKGIMNFVDELSHNYDRRLAALHIEYQKDVEEILACYKSEKQEFKTQITEKDQTISSLETELKALKQSYHTLNVEYKLSRDGLETAKQELKALTSVLKKEEELLSITKEQIQVANTQLKLELAALGVESAPHVASLEAPVTAKKARFKRTREFLRQLMADRLSRPIMLRPKKKPPIEPEAKDFDLPESQDFF